MGLNKLTDVNFVVPALVVALLAMFIANRVPTVGNIVRA